MKMLRVAAAVAWLHVVMLSHAFAGGVAYLAGGAGCPFFMFTDGMAQIGAQLKARRFEVHNGCNFPISQIAALRRGRVVLIGHSYGAMHAAEAARELKRVGIYAEVIAIEPLWTPLVGATCAGVANCICFYHQGKPMPAARNVFLQSDRQHVSYPSDPRVQAAVLAAVGR